MDPLDALDEDLKVAIGVGGRVDTDPVRLGYPPPEPGELTSATREILGRVRDFLRRYVVLSGAASVAVALWVLHTWAIGAFETTPRLAVTSAERRSGKSRLLEVLERLVREPLYTANISVAALFRIVDESCPTVLFDEVDTIFKPRGRDDAAEDLRGLLNSGHRRRGGEVVRMVGQGAGLRTRRFKVFAPVALAAIGKLPDTLGDRSIPVRLERRANDEPVAPFRFREAEAAASPIRERLERWAQAAAGALAEARPEVPSGLNDRAADSWEPLLAIADLAGPEWAEEARRAALALHGEEEVRSAGEELLAAIRRVFDQAGGDRICSKDLVAALNEEEDAPWGGELTPRSLAARLRRYKRADGGRLTPGTIRMPDGSTAKGYLVEWFSEAFRRHLPSVSVTSVTNVTSQVGATRAVTDVTLVTDRDGKPAPEGPCPECGAQRAARGYWGHALSCWLLHHGPTVDERDSISARRLASLGAT
jgi:hypothetical protein